MADLCGLYVADFESNLKFLKSSNYVTISDVFWRFTRFPDVLEPFYTQQKKITVWFFELFSEIRVINIMDDKFPSKVLWRSLTFSDVFRRFPTFSDALHSETIFRVALHILWDFKCFEIFGAVFWKSENFLLRNRFLWLEVVNICMWYSEKLQNGFKGRFFLDGLHNI